MTNSQQPPSSNKWLRANITSDFLTRVLAKTERLDLETELSRYSSQLIHRGTRSEVYLLTIPSPQSQISSLQPQNSWDLIVIVKRFLSPKESVQMRAGLDDLPTDEHRSVDQHEYMNLVLLRKLVPDQVRPYIHDPERHVVVMEALSGDYDARLTGFYNDYRAATKKTVRDDIKHRVVEDLDTILKRVHATMYKATQFALVNRSQLVLVPSNKFELGRLFTLKYNALHPAGRNITLPSLKGQPAFLIQSSLTQVANNNSLNNWMEKYDSNGERQELLKYLMKLEEGVIHRDMRPENILIRSSGPPLEVVLTDFAEMGWGPVDQDMVTLLMDSRLKRMFTLAERRAIYDRHLDEELLPNYDIARDFQTPEARTLRFSLAAINFLLSDIRFTVTYPQQVDPARSLATQGNLRTNSTHRRFPLPNLRDHFVTQFLSLAQILSTVRQTFPKLYQGVISFYPESRRETFRKGAADEERHGDMMVFLSRLYEDGVRLRRKYTPS